jgi:hypothetical protein
MERRGNPGSVALGVILVLVGAAYLATQYLPRPVVDVDVGHYGWPVFVIVPGLVLLGFGLTAQGLSGLTVPGSIITMAGLVLAVQNTFDLFATWAYAWALVAPGGVGVGLWLQGLVSRRPAERAAGLRLMGLGLVLFLVGAAFFEGVVHVSGREFGIVGQVLLPALLIAAGVWLLVRRAFPQRQ